MMSSTATEVTAMLVSIRSSAVRRLTHCTAGTSPAAMTVMNVTAMSTISTWDKVRRFTPPDY